MREIRLFVAVLLMSILIVPFIGCSKKKGEEQQTSTAAAELAEALSNATLISTDRESICLLDQEGSLMRYTRHGGTPLSCAFDQTGGKAYFCRRNIVEFDRASMKTRIIDLPENVTGIAFVVLPNNRFAVLNNRNDEIHVVDGKGSLLKTVRMNLAPDSHLQNVMGVVVGNSLIVSEDGDRQLLALDLETYELSVFKRLPNLRPWLGQLAFHKGLYYISTARAIYTFRNSEDEPKKLVELSKRNITGLAVTDTNLFVVINFSAEIPHRGEIIRMDLKGQNRAVVCEGLKRPKGLAIVPIEKK